MSHINLQYTTLTVPVPDFISEHLGEYVRSSNSYHPQPHVLVDRLAKKHHVSPDMIYLTAGADEAIQMFALAYGKHVHMFPPTYVVYAETGDFHATVHQTEAFVDDRYSVPTDTISDASLILIANPNNPFGTTSKEKLQNLIKNNSHSMIVVDEVYGEFRPDLSIINELIHFPHVAVLRSFSKAYGMAGIRLGYMLASPQIIETVKKKTQWSNVSYLSVGVAIAALNHNEYFQEQIQTIIRLRTEFVQTLKKKGYHLIETDINAVMLKFDTTSKAQTFVDYLSSKNITVSHGNGGSNCGLDTCFVRIAIGTAKEMKNVSELINLLPISK